jgi:hypothetical protein
MANYVWELGIDWDAVETAGVSYLRGGLVGSGGPLPGTAPVLINDTIVFKIFDVTSSGGPKVAGIGSFVILTQRAVEEQKWGKGLSSLQPAVTITSDPPTPVSMVFPNFSSSWIYDAVTVAIPVEQGQPPSAGSFLRFLLTTQVQAIGLDGAVRLFSHDPEMVVGPFG